MVLPVFATLTFNAVVGMLDMLPELIEEGRRILLFSQFTGMLELIAAALEAARIPYVVLTGETTDRVTPVQRFQQGEVPLFLINLKAGGVGLNLTADTCREQPHKQA
ncbi:SNF2 family DNA or RNA helicase [Paraburkholderia sp. JPY465]